MVGVNYTVSECLHIGNNIYNEEWTTAQRPWQHPAQKAQRPWQHPAQKTKDEDKQNNTDSNKNRG